MIVGSRLALTLLLLAGQNVHAFGDNAAVGPEARVAVGPRRPPSAKACSLPHSGSLVTDERSAAYLRTCSKVMPGYPTTLHVVEFPNARRPKALSYQLRTRPELVAMKKGHILWAEIGPDPVKTLGDRLRLVDFDTATGRAHTLDEIQLPFVGSLNTIKRGNGCWLAQISKGPPAMRRMALVTFNETRIGKPEVSQDEWPLFWDPAHAGFVIAEIGSGRARTADCESRRTQAGSAAAAVLSSRPVINRYFSLPALSAIAIDQVGALGRQELLSASNDASTYRVIASFDSIHGVSGHAASNRIAVLTTESIELFQAGTKTRSLHIPKGSGWNTQIEFLKGRPGLVVLDDMDISLIDAER
jgi:hypothetical protein